MISVHGTLQNTSTYFQKWRQVFSLRNLQSKISLYFSNGIQVKEGGWTLNFHAFWSIIRTIICLLNRRCVFFPKKSSTCVSLAYVLQCLPHLQWWSHTMFPMKGHWRLQADLLLVSHCWDPLSLILYPFTSTERSSSLGTWIINDT